MRLMMLPLLLTAGCAMTPEQTVERGTRYAFASVQSAGEAASCLARRTDERHSLVATLRRSVDPGAWEIVIRVEGGSLGAIGVVRVSPVGGGSNVDAWIAPPLQSESFIQWLKDGAC